MKALLIVDVQNDFLPNGNLAIDKGDKIIPIINELQEYFEIVVATQDWHPPHHKSFASNHTDKKVFEKIILNGHEQTLWPDHCIQNSFGAAFSSALQQEKIRAIFRKGMNSDVDSYSGFFDNNKISATGLEGFLKNLEITDLYVCGLAADFCVNFTTQDANNQGFKTYFIEDAAKAIDPKNFETIKKKLIKQGIIFISSSDIKKPAQ